MWGNFGCKYASLVVHFWLQINMQNIDLELETGSQLPLRSGGATCCYTFRKPPKHGRNHDRARPVFNWRSGTSQTV